jgi:hypothetical protein
VEEPEDQAKKYGFYQSRDPIVLGAGRNADIAVISDQTSGVRPWDPKQPFAKDLIHAEYGHRERFDSYGTGGENLYLEIDESVVERAAGTVSRVSCGNGATLRFRRFAFRNVSAANTFFYRVFGVE